MNLKWLLAVLTPIYGIAVFIRNKLFDWNLLKSEGFDVPIITVGNIAVGGTGKTPHIEYLIRLLSPEYGIAVLSRGYKRKCKGYILATENSSANDIGDEPYQIKRKFPSITVAVDANRRRGIRNLMLLNPSIDVILMDDAFQHRYVNPLVSILLTDYKKMFYDDALLPLGTLREPSSAKYRANIVIVTKCPDHIVPIDKRILIKKLDLHPYQQLFFSTPSYGNLVPLHKTGDEGEIILNDLPRDSRILAVSGIANPKPFNEQLSSSGLHVEAMNFDDHHDFTKQNIKTIERDFLHMKTITPNSYIVITEKDAAKLVNINVPDTIRSYIYVLPIVIKFHRPDGTVFNKYIKDTINTNYIT